MRTIKRIVSWFILTFVLQAHKVWNSVGIEIRTQTSAGFYKEAVDSIGTFIYYVLMTVAAQSKIGGVDKDAIYERVASMLHYRFKIDRKHAAAGMFADAFVHDADVQSRSVLYDLQHRMDLEDYILYVARMQANATTESLHRQLQKHWYIQDKAKHLGVSVEEVLALPRFVV